MLGSRWVSTTHRSSAGRKKQLRPSSSLYNLDSGPYKVTGQLPVRKFPHHNPTLPSSISFRPSPVQSSSAQTLHSAADLFSWKLHPRFSADHLDTPWRSTLGTSSALSARSRYQSPKRKGQEVPTQRSTKNYIFPRQIPSFYTWGGG